MNGTGCAHDVMCRDSLEKQWHHMVETYMKDSLRNVSKNHVEWVLRAANGNVVTAALVFGISVKEMMQLLRELGIEHTSPSTSLNVCGSCMEKGGL